MNSYILMMAIANLCMVPSGDSNYKKVQLEQQKCHNYYIHCAVDKRKSLSKCVKWRKL